jgi:hypothetical protein
MSSNELSLVNIMDVLFTETLNLSFSVLDGDEPRHWAIWNLGFEDVAKRVRAINGHIPPYPTRSEFNLLDQTASQLYQRDSWINVVGTIIHLSDESHLNRLRAVHKNICHYLKRQREAVCREVGYYLLPVADSPNVDDERLINCIVDFLDDAGKALGRTIPEFAPLATSERDLTNSLKFVARRIVYLREVASDT